MKKDKATLICIVDVSGSMGKTKKKSAHNIFLLNKSCLTNMYNEVEEVFIAHTTTATIRTEQEIFGQKCETGGTYLSSGATLALNTIRFNECKDGDVYVMFCSDGDNWSEDNNEFIMSVNEIVKISKKVRFYEIKILSYTSVILSRLNKEVEQLITSDFKCVRVNPYHENTCEQLSIGDLY